ncbi:MAG: carbohydrate ABC transporter permease [Epulopiscium sp.]|nr:carbohydrate ABC transporter permease [Candidatus Epulonipiscium sp.]
MIKESISRKVFRLFNGLLMIFMMIICLYPMLYVLFASFSHASRFMEHQGPLLKPLGFNLESYKMVFRDPMIIKGYGNTIFIVVIGTLFNILMTAFCAYFLSRKNVMFKTPIMIFVTFTMFFSGGLIPFYLTVRNVGLYNNHWALILPGVINTYNMIIMRTGFQGIPDSMEESAKIDGAGHLTILFRIVLPLAKPVMAVMVLYYAVGHWNGWFNAMIFLQDRKKFPLQLILREILIQNDTSQMTGGVSAVDQEAIGETIKHAVIVVATLPILMVYPFLQKYFVEGIMIGAIKG